MRIEGAQMPGPIDLEQAAVQPCSYYLVVTRVVLKLVHGVFEAKHLHTVRSAKNHQQKTGIKSFSHRRIQLVERDLVPR